MLNNKYNSFSKDQVNITLEGNAIDQLKLQQLRLSNPNFIITVYEIKN